MKIEKEMIFMILISIILYFLILFWIFKTNNRSIEKFKEFQKQYLLCIDRIKEKKANKNMPYHIPADAMPFHISNFDDPNNNEMKVKHGIAVIPDRGIIIVKLPENVRLIVEQEGCQ